MFDGVWLGGRIEAQIQLVYPINIQSRTCYSNDILWIEILFNVSEISFSHENIALVEWNEMDVFVELKNTEYWYHLTIDCIQW